MRGESFRRAKKEEFPGFMDNMLPGNSFPQICVVSKSILLRTSYLNMFTNDQP